jgi:carbohydrate-binding DOMON domain-containing protein
MEDETQKLQRRITDAVQAHEFVQTEAWGALAALSSDTQIETVETFDDEVRIEGNSFAGPLIWYVKLRYGQEQTEDYLVLSESFPGHFEGRFEGEEPIIEQMTADTSSFYE